jgi:hypothetical protein
MSTISIIMADNPISRFSSFLAVSVSFLGFGSKSVSGPGQQVSRTFQTKKSQRSLPCWRIMVKFSKRGVQFDAIMLLGV